MRAAEPIEPLPVHWADSATLTDGTIVVAYHAIGEPPRLVRSGDDGKTWSQPEAISFEFDLPYGLGADATLHAVPGQATGERLFLVFRRKAETVLRVVTSDDAGSTWSDPTLLGDGTLTAAGSMVPPRSIVRYAPGVLLMATANTWLSGFDIGAGDGDLMFFYSEDGGDSWSEQAPEAATSWGVLSSFLEGRSPVLLPEGNGGDDHWLLGRQGDAAYASRLGHSARWAADGRFGRQPACRNADGLTARLTGDDDRLLVLQARAPSPMELELDPFAPIPDADDGPVTIPRVELWLGRERDLGLGSEGDGLVDLGLASHADLEVTRDGMALLTLVRPAKPGQPGMLEIARLDVDAARNPDVLPRGYAIPLIDLADDAARQVVVDREPGQYLGHPTTVLLEDGRTMIVVYPKGHGRGAIVMKRSDDGGLTWSERLPTPDNWDSSKETPTIHRTVAANGVKRLILFSGLHPLRLSISEDDGRSWTPLQPVVATGFGGGLPFGGIVTMASVEAMRETPGGYMAFFHDDGRFLNATPGPSGFDVFMTRSIDGGRSWSAPRIVATHPTAHLCEPGTVRSPDGRQLALLLRENSRTRNAFVVFSDDEGITWSHPVELPGALTGDRHVARYAPDGRLVISFRDTTHDSPTKGDWVAWVGRYEDIRNGTEGQYRIRLMDNHVRGDCAYPGVEVLPDGTFVCTTYGHWTPNEEPYIVSVRFTLDEIDALAPAP